MKKSQSASITLLLLSSLCLALVSAHHKCYTNLTVTSGSEGFTFNPGDYFGDINGYHLTFESNCNLVLYNGQTPLWASASWQDNNPNCIAVFQGDGNLVVYSTNERVSTNALWAAGTWTQIQVASLQINNGRLQVVETYNGNYDIVLDVSNPPPRSTQRPFRTSASHSILVKSTDQSDFVFQQQQYIGDLDNTNLIFQYDCNLVLYDPSGPLWASGSVRDAQYICELAVKRDGSLVVYAAQTPSIVYWTWDGNNGETEEGGEIVATELVVLDGAMQIIHSLSDGSTRTYSTVNGDLTLIY